MVKLNIKCQKKLTCKNHGLIIKWTQHIDFLTLAGTASVEEGNHGNNSKEG